jgi:aspartyl/asparaginyl beta-hydroxylase (cupin superfamily)
MMAGETRGRSAVRLARRAVFRAAARPRRKLIWTQLRRRAASQGFAPQDLERFYHYLATHLRLEQPEYVEPLQKPASYFSGLRAQPVHAASDFPWISSFIRDFETIRDELLEYSKRLTLDAQPQGLTDRGRWSVLYFYAGGRPVEETMRACRRTSELIKSIPGAGEAGQSYLSVLRAGTHIKRHFGPTNTRLRCHLGLIVPEGSRIRIGEKMYQWREGDCLVFDDSFEHEVWNDSDRERIVLIMDFWHPELTPAERWAITEARNLRFGSLRFGIRDVLQPPRPYSPPREGPRRLGALLPLRH